MSFNWQLERRMRAFSMVLDEAGIDEDQFYAQLHSHDPWLVAATYAAVHLLADVLHTEPCEASGILGRGPQVIFYGRRKYHGNALAVQIADAVKRKLGRIYAPAPNSRSNASAQ